MSLGPLVLAWALFAIGGSICALNAYLSWLRYPLHRLRGGSAEEYRWVSGAPAIGSVLVLAGWGLLAGEVDSSVLTGAALGLLLVDTGGLHWFVLVMLVRWIRGPGGAPDPVARWSTPHGAAVQIGRHPAWAQHLRPPYELSFGPEAPFAALVSVHDPAVTPEDQGRLSADLVRLGCRYAVCRGHDCSSWDDSIDDAYLETDANHDPPDETFVMTTWHTDESLADIAEFLVRTARFEGFVPERFLVVCVGGAAEEFAEVCEAVLAALEQRAREK